MTHTITTVLPLDLAATLKAGRYAAIDIGTVTCRLLVADITDDGRLVELCRAMEICNLGEGVDRAGRLAPEAIERTGAAIDGFMAMVHRWRNESMGSIPLKAVATSASRDAKNASEFRARLAQSGVELAIIPGEQEAVLSFAGATAAIDSDRAVVIDVGGGSTEMVAGRGIGTSKAGHPAHLGPEAEHRIQFAHSFNIGCRRLTERFLVSDPPTLEEMDKTRDCIALEIQTYIDQLKAAGCFDGPLVAVAGTATSCVTMRDDITNYDPNLVNGAFVSATDLNSLIQKLSAMPLAQRRNVIGLEPRRAEVILAGLLILDETLRLASLPGFMVSELDILQGIIIQLAHEGSC